MPKAREPARVWAEVAGGDALGRGQQPALCWWLPEGSSVQHAYRLRTDDGYDTGRVEGAIQSFVPLPVFDRSRRSALARVMVWTDVGESVWSDPVLLDSGLLGEQDWLARWIGVEEAERPGKGSRPAYWFRTVIEVPPSAEARLYLTALGLYEAFLAGGHLTTGFLSTAYLLPVLADHGYLGTAYELLLQDTPPSWLTMVDRGATTVWEEWEGVDGRGVPHASLNHYSKGAVASFLHRYVAGLRPAEPAYRTFEVRPRPGGGITSAMARHLSPFGPIEVSWQLAGGTLELDLLVPPGTTATVTLPGEEPRGARPGRHRWTGAA